MTAIRTTVHVMRHGEVYNPEKVLYGRLPGYNLSDRGREQAQSAADWLAPKDITYVVASPLERAQQTAAPIDLGNRKSIGWTSTHQWLEAALRGEDYDA